MARDTRSATKMDDHEMENSYAYWKAALAGEKPPMYVDDPQPGFYRKGVYTKEPNKAAKRTGWVPVAVFLNPLDGNQFVAVINGNAEMDRDNINELWSYIAANPIHEETYRAVAENGEAWPDDISDFATV